MNSIPTCSLRPFTILFLAFKELPQYYLIYGRSLYRIHEDNNQRYSTYRHYPE